MGWGHRPAERYPQEHPSTRIPFPQLPTSHRQACPPPWVYHQTPSSSPPSAGPASPYHAAQAGPLRSKGTDYLLSLQTDMSNLALTHSPPRVRTISSPGSDKPLPRLPPPPPLPTRPYSHGDARDVTPSSSTPAYGQSGHVGSPHAGHTGGYAPRPSTAHDSPSMPSPIRSTAQTPPRAFAFRPSINLTSPSTLYPPRSEPRLARPHSEPAVPFATPPRAKYRQKKDPVDIIVIDDSDSDTASTSSSVVPTYITNRSPARRKRATSENPARAARPTAHLSTTPSKTSTPTRGSGHAVRCAGFTRKGAPCQRLVKAEAPYLAMADLNTDKEDRIQARYCKDHAGMICNAKGFYWKSSKEDAGVWVDFGEFIPDDLGQQTQALLRMTMESPLTDKEAPGFLYAYELRDLQNSSSSFYKVGRTDNVPRRIGEWTTRCRTHTPTLRDIFPIATPTADSPNRGLLSRAPTLPTSYLPGAFRQTTNPQRTCPAVKRWERLVHLELADLSNRHAPHEYANLKEKCVECQAVHREIFPLGNGDRVYEERVMEVVCRWERFIRKTNAAE